MADSQDLRVQRDALKSLINLPAWQHYRTVLMKLVQAKQVSIAQPPSELCSEVDRVYLAGEIQALWMAATVPEQEIKVLDVQIRQIETRAKNGEVN